MRRVPALVAAALVLAGLELSTQAVTLVAVRLRMGTLAVLSGVDFYVSEMRFGLGILAMLLGTLLFVLIGWAAVERGVAMRVGRSCPRCGRDTKRVKRSEWERMASALAGDPLVRRQCDECGWVGLSAVS